MDRIGKRRRERQRSRSSQNFGAICGRLANEEDRRLTKKDIRPTWIVLDFFKNPNLPFSATLGCLESKADRISTFSLSVTRSPNSEISASGEDVMAVVLKTCRLREYRRARVRRAESARLTSCGASASVSADESGELSATIGGRGTTLIWGERVLQRGRRVGKPRGDDCAVTGAEDCPFGTSSSNET